MKKDELRQVISDTIGQVGPSPCLYFSGGVDSSILLYELIKKVPRETLYVFTAAFCVDKDEADHARAAAAYFNITNHHFIKINLDEMLHKDLPHILKHFPAPRWNVWPWYLAEAVKAACCETVYIGEGSDEIFGGYPDRDYLHGWAGQINYVRYTYNIIHNAFGLTLKAPFSELDWVQLLKENTYQPPNKAFLKEAYDGLIPDWILQHSQPPAAKSYFDAMGGPAVLEKIACKAWLNAHRGNWD